MLNDIKSVKRLVRSHPVESWGHEMTQFSKKTCEKSKVNSFFSENVDFLQDKKVGICPGPGIQESRWPRASKNLYTPLEEQEEEEQEQEKEEEEISVF